MVVSVLRAWSASCQKRKTRERNKLGSGGCAHEESRRRLSTCGLQKQTCAKNDSKRNYLLSLHPPTHHSSITSCIAPNSQVMTLVWDRFLASQHYWQAPAMQKAKRGTCNALLLKTAQKVMHEALLSVLEEEGEKKGWEVGLVVNFSVVVLFCFFSLCWFRLCFETIQVKCIWTSSSSTPGLGTSGGGSG